MCFLGEEVKKGLPKIRLAEADAVGEGVSRSSREVPQTLVEGLDFFFVKKSSGV